MKTLKIKLHMEKSTAFYLHITFRLNLAYFFYIVCIYFHLFSVPVNAIFTFVLSNIQTEKKPAER